MRYKFFILKKVGILALLCFSLAKIQAQTIKDYSVRVRATVSEIPAKITLEWETSSFATNTSIYKKLKTQPNFSSNAIATIPAPSNTYTDNSVQDGVEYDYLLIQNASFTNNPNSAYELAWGGISAGINVNLPGHKGALLLIVDTTLKNSLNTKVNRFIDDLTEDGWVVSVADKTISDSVLSIKQKINTWYNSNTEAKSVVLLGNIPVPYSGNFGIVGTPPDAHVPDHNGAWAADVFYAIPDNSLFTDFETNINGITREANKNRPGDGKYDQSTIPGTVVLQIGRIDMSNLSSVSGSYLEKTERYLDKNHLYRNGEFKIPYRYVFTDNLGLLGGEAPGRLHFFQSNLFETNQIKQVTPPSFFDSVKNNAYLFSSVTSSAGYTQINNVGNVTNFSDTVQSVFNNYFGSYFADWDISNNFLRGAIAGPGYTLTSIWSGRPVVHFHHMALGNNIGFSLLHAQNNGFATGSLPFYPGAFSKSIHLSMHGDPTLKMHTVLPITNIAGNSIENNKKVEITWTTSSQSGIVGYNIYRSNSLTGETYYLLNNTPINTTTYIDENPWKGKNVYMVRAVYKQETPSGTFYNLSQGRRIELANIDGSNTTKIDYLDLSNSLSLYPNPSTGELNLFSSNLKETSKIQILTLHGATIRQFENVELYNGFTVNLSELVPGAYLIKIQTLSKSTTLKWVKQ
jgi:hypothetical protein